MIVISSTAKTQAAIQEARRQRSAAFLSLFRRTKPNPETKKPGCGMAAA
ncbi:hypothetical protein [Actibacterium atlanticum]|nr:hypothetical protein [Actibacterium atlanticum]